MHFDLEKDTAKVRFMLEKRDIPSLVAEVIAVVDVSGSTQSMFYSGAMQAALQRVVPVALNFDDNGELPTYLFDDDCHLTANPITAKNYATYVKKEILHDGFELWGGTQLEPVLKRVVRDLGFYDLRESKVGFFKSLFSKSSNDSPDSPVSMTCSQKSKSGLPAIVYIFTDGENTDHAYTSGLLKRLADAKSEVYFNFIGVGNVTFNFLREVADEYPNVGFAQIKDIAATGGSDDIYEYLIPEELTDLLKAFVGTSAQPVTR